MWVSHMEVKEQSILEPEAATSQNAHAGRRNWQQSQDGMWTSQANLANAPSIHSVLV